MSKSKNQSGYWNQMWSLTFLKSSVSAHRVSVWKFSSWTWCLWRQTLLELISNAKTLSPEATKYFYPEQSQNQLRKGRSQLNVLASARNLGFRHVRLSFREFRLQGSNYPKFYDLGIATSVRRLKSRQLAFLHRGKPPSFRKKCSS